MNFDPSAALAAACRVDKSYSQYNLQVENSRAMVEVENGIQYLSLPGTNIKDVRDIVEDVNIRRTAVPGIGTFISGFLDRWLLIRDVVKFKLDPMLPTVICDHSSGAGAGDSACFDIKAWGIKIIRRFSFGHPLATLEDAALAYDALGIETWRVENLWDPVCGVPLYIPIIFPVRHIQIPIYLGRSSGKIYVAAHRFSEPLDINPVEWEEKRWEVHHTTAGQPDSYVENLRSLCNG